MGLKLKVQNDIVSGNGLALVASFVRYRPLVHQPEYTALAMSSIHELYRLNIM